MKIGFVLFENFHQRRDIAGSRIRGKWLIKYWPEAEEFIQGKDYDVVIYQKCYWKEHAKAFKGMKILDVCDPDWLDGWPPVIDFMNLMDAITVPTKALKEAIEKFCSVPVFIIPDRIDLETLPAQKKDSGQRAKSVVWFGYSHNSDVIEPALPLLRNLGLTLKVISNGTYRSHECETESIDWKLETVNEEIQKADFALLPVNENGRGKYKSNNKEILARSLGLTVAKTAEDLKRLIDPEERKKDLLLFTEEDKMSYDVRKSVEEMKNVIESASLSYTLHPNHEFEIMTKYFWS